jgi:hypothetical protein
LRGVQSIYQAITDLWDELIFEDVQAVFFEWMNRLSWVIENKGEYFIQWLISIWKMLTGRRNQGVSSQLLGRLHCIEFCMRSEGPCLQILFFAFWEPDLPSISVFPDWTTVRNCPAITQSFSECWSSNNTEGTDPSDAISVIAHRLAAIATFKMTSAREADSNDSEPRSDPKSLRSSPAFARFLFLLSIASSKSLSIYQFCATYITSIWSANSLNSWVMRRDGSLKEFPWWTRRSPSVECFAMVPRNKQKGAYEHRRDSSSKKKQID